MEIYIHENTFETIVCKMAAILSGGDNKMLYLWFSTILHL